MGWFNDILGAAAPIAGGIFGGPVGAAIGGGIGGLLSSHSSSTPSGNATTTQQQQMDPRIAGMLFGDGSTGSQGLLPQYQGMLGQPQNAGINTYGRATDAYLGYDATQDQNKIRDLASSQMKGNIPAVVTPGAVIKAPAQNGMDLTGSYDKFINGDPAANPYLTGAIQKGIDQSTNAFTNMQTDATRNLTQNVLPSIRSGAQAAGGYGGSRQGIAEGLAMGQFGTDMARAAGQFGQNNTDAAVAAQSGQFSQGQDRALAATQGLGAQQYGVASQNAQFDQQANLTNNQAQQNANALNATVQQQGANNLSGILGSAYTVGQNQDSYALNQAGKVNGLLAPYLGQVPGSSTTSQPLYQNTGGNALAGATAGMALGKQFSGLLGSSGSSSGQIYGLGT